MAEKSVSQMLKETLFYDPKPATVRLSDEELAAADRYCEGYRAFLDRSKTEREAVPETRYMSTTGERLCCWP